MASLSTPGIRFIVTSLCNYDCNYCHNEWEPKKGPLTGIEEKLIRELIGAVKELGAFEVDITGGEPLLKINRVETILKVAKEFRMWTNITTNGYFLEQYAERLAGYGLDEVHIHIPSLDPCLYRKLMRGNSDLEMVLSGVKKIKNLVGKTRINVPIEFKVNDSEIHNFIAYFSPEGIIPRFIEVMSTNSYNANGQRIFDRAVKERIGTETKLKGSYLWGINEYESDLGSFETLRCICFDRKCDICPTTNFIHVDQNYKIRPCNLRNFRIQAQEGDCSASLRKAIEFLNEQTDIPNEYKRLWGETYVPLSIWRGEAK